MLLFNFMHATCLVQWNLLDLKYLVKLKLPIIPFFKDPVASCLFVDLNFPLSTLFLHISTYVLL